MERRHLSSENGAKSHVISSSATPIRGHRERKSRSPADTATPKLCTSSKSAGKATAIPVQTPYLLRSKIKQRLNKMTTDEAASESEDDSSSESQSSSSEEKDMPNQGSPKRQTRLSPTKSVMTANTIQSMQTRAEEYFRSHECKRALTSDNMLSHLEIGHFDHEELHKLLQNVPNSHKQQIDYLLALTKKKFPQWLFQLSQGYNILLHGLGSKIHLLREFQKFIAVDFTVVVVNGFFPSITIKQILNAISEDALEHKGEFKKPEDQATFIRQTLRTSNDGKLVLIVNSIDGAMLRNERAQSILCSLAQCDEIYVLASVDHINAPLLWDQQKMNAFNWLWKDVTNFLPYTEETSYENSLFVRQTGALALSSLSHVFHSLTPNAKGIFLLLAQYQLDNKDKSNNYIGMAFQDCYQKCREAFLVNSELTLKAQLTEFKDHKLLKVKKGADGEHLMIPLDDFTISEFLISQNKNSL